MAVRPNAGSRRSSVAYFGWPVALMAASLVLFSVALQAQSGKENPKAAAKPAGTATVRIELTGGDTKKPIEDASVYVKFNKIEFNLKTNQNGIARSPQVPKGRILIQIVAPGWKTFGQYYDITEDEQTIQINIERPSTRWIQ